MCKLPGSIPRFYFPRVLKDKQGIPETKRQCNEPCSHSGGQKRTPPAVRELPSRWYTLLALPFPDQQVGRREIARAHRHAHRAGHFSNPLWVRWRLYFKVPTACTRHSVDMVADVGSPSQCAATTLINYAIIYLRYAFS